MSPEDRESRRRLITQFWTMYQEDLEAARGLPAGTIDDFAQNLVAHVSAADGDAAIAAHNTGHQVLCKEAIDTLRLDWNVFRVGTHKSFGCM